MIFIEKRTDPKAIDVFHSHKKK